MASNDPVTEVDPVPLVGPVAYLTKIIRFPARNDQTPLRVAYLLAIGLTMAATPTPWNVIGIVSLIALALSLGRLTPLR